MLELFDFEQSPEFDDVQKAVIRLAKAMCETPSRPSDALVTEMRRYFTDRQLVELVSAIAWENYRARFNRVFGVEAAGFMETASHGQTTSV
ncbi:MAG: hypothetical protein U0Q16_15590 [Bryobacteraceae bacterium]